MLKTILMAVVGFVLLWLALVAELSAHECGDYLSPSLSATAQENLCAEVSASITGKGVRAPRYSAVGTVEGTEPRLEAVSPRVVDYRGLQGHVVDYRIPRSRCTGRPYWGRGCRKEMLAAHAARALERAGGDECDQAYRRLSDLPPCTRYERAMQEVE